MKYLGELIKKQPCTWLEAAKKSKKENSQQFQELADSIAKSYDLYESLITSCDDELDESSFIEHSSLLIEYYEKAPKKLNDYLLERRNEHELSSCPYCGNPMYPDTLDHFVPKSKWPEFSIYPNNLVPQCRGCAPVKGENYFCHDNDQTMFIHPFYFNILENFRFSMKVSFDTNKKEICVNVQLKEIINTRPEDQARIILHTQKLKVKKRIISYCHKEYRQWIRRLSNANFDIKSALTQRLIEVAELEVGRDWQSSFYSAILDNEDVINHMNSFCQNEALRKNKKNGVYLDF